MAPQLNITVHRLIDCESISSAEQTKEQSFKPLTDKTSKPLTGKTSSTHTPDLEESKVEILQSFTPIEADDNEANDIDSIEGTSSNDKKQLRWASRIKVRPIKHIKAMSKREMKRTWYDEEEYRSFKIESQQTIKLVHESIDGQLHPDFETELCTRGLESALSARRNALRRRLKSEAWDVVLEEQDYQKQNGADSTLYIAEVYKELSAWALEIAQIQALIDQEDVEQEGQNIMEMQSSD